MYHNMNSIYIGIIHDIDLCFTIIICFSIIFSFSFFPSLYLSLYPYIPSLPSTTFSILIKLFLSILSLALSIFIFLFSSRVHVSFHISPFFAFLLSSSPFLCIYLTDPSLVHIPSLSPSLFSLSPLSLYLLSLSLPLSLPFPPSSHSLINKLAGQLILMI